MAARGRWNNFSPTFRISAFPIPLVGCMFLCLLWNGARGIWKYPNKSQWPWNFQLNFVTETKQVITEICRGFFFLFTQLSTVSSLSFVKGINDLTRIPIDLLVPALPLCTAWALRKDKQHSYCCLFSYPKLTQDKHTGSKLCTFCVQVCYACLVCILFHVQHPCLQVPHGKWNDSSQYCNNCK